MNKIWLILLFFFLLHQLDAQSRKKQVENDTRTNTITQITKKRSRTMIYKCDQGGNLVECGYRKKGLKDKTWVSYDEHGNICVVGNFENGIRSGTWLVFDSAGKVKYEIEYERNRIIKALDWHERHMASSQQ